MRTMESLKDVIGQGWMGVIIGIIAGLIISYIFYTLSRIRPGMAVQKNSYTVIQPGHQVEPGELEIVFRGIKVPRLTLSIIVIWNSGNTTLQGSQAVSTDPLRIITTMESQIIEVRQKPTRLVNGFNTSVNTAAPNELECSFDYLDPRDGVRLTILHSGNNDVRVAGTFRGLPQGLRDLGQLPETKRDRFEVILMIVILIAGFILIVGPPFSDPMAIGILLFLMAFGLSAVVFSISVLWRQRRRIPKSLLAQEND
jgi:hypothetical protein